MKSRKSKLLAQTNLMLENRYLNNKFLSEQDEPKKPKLQVTAIEDKGPVKKWKISLFQEKETGGLKDIMTPEIIQKLDLKQEYVDQESAAIDLQKVNQSELEKLVV
jgi:hypothetical protein